MSGTVQGNLAGHRETSSLLPRAPKHTPNPEALLHSTSASIIPALLKMFSSIFGNEQSFGLTIFRKNFPLRSRTPRSSCFRCIRYQFQATSRPVGTISLANFSSLESLELYSEPSLTGSIIAIDAASPDGLISTSSMPFFERPKASRVSSLMPLNCWRFFKLHLQEVDIAFTNVPQVAIAVPVARLNQTTHTSRRRRSITAWRGQGRYQKTF